MASFRFRIALFAALLAGSAVTGFGTLAYVFLYQSKLKSLDNDIQTTLMQEAAMPRPAPYWETFSQSRAFYFYNRSESEALLFVLANDGQILYQSEHWQSTLEPYSLFLPQPEFTDLIELRDERLLSPPDLLKPLPPSSQILQPNINPRQDLLPLQEISRVSKPVTRKDSQGKWRLVTAASPHVRMAIAVNLSVIDQDMSIIRSVFLVLIPVTLLLVMAGAWWLSSDALESLHRITQIIRNVSAKELSQRASTATLDIEFIELVNVFNQMMERLERSFQQASRFSADAAHELKTPLAILQGELERSVQQTDAGSELQQTFSHLLDEVRRLSAITRKLLLLSLADAGQMRLQKVEINFSQMVRDLAEDIDLLAPKLAVDIDVPASLKLYGDLDLLAQVLQNLVTNAVKYNVPLGWIRLCAKLKNNHVVLTVANASKDIASGDRQRIFDRFQRGDASRNRTVEGFGLGLSLSREIVRAHGGDLTLDPSPPGSTAFSLSLPI